jgi:hypothetical protein
VAVVTNRLKEKQVETITLTPAMLDAIQREMAELTAKFTTNPVAEIRVTPRNGSTVHVLFDAGWGTSGFIVNRNGRTIVAAHA